MTQRRHFYWIQLASAHSRKRANRDLETAGLTVSQLGALYVIAQGEACALKDLAAALHINASAVTTLSGRLRKAGLVSLQASEHDRRVSLLRLTPKGRKAISDARPLLAEMNQGLQAGFTAEELQVVERFLRQCIVVSSGRSDV